MIGQVREEMEEEEGREKREEEGKGGGEETCGVVDTLHFDAGGGVGHDEEGGEGGSEGRKGKGMRWCRL
jgi:hypothetical protein